MPDESEKDEQKTERFNMFMSPSEMKAIDDWAWHNKIRSKSEAVRRLCQIGLLVGGELDGLSDITIKMSDALRDLDDETFSFWGLIADPANKGDKLNREAVLSLLQGILDRIEKIEAAASDISSALVGLYSGAIGIATHDSDEGQRLASAALGTANETMAKMRELRVQRRATMSVLSDISYKGPKTSEVRPDGEPEL
ncbi:hypothetical protein PMI07_002080 [Rhizobium sp. CF080]|uniref:hypothetical protein n=1 Tax=Rhizobium sp. (strain CF080) TaxID=1144310 RepID=UPI0002719B04|nr:hypothetical protein [Rhizobium sp. CF080]EUB95592.1 hypothetical protein PMI07_002080 [Rhizobium sp. CF080]